MLRKRRKRSDARRNQRILLDAAAVVFVRAGVDAPVRDIAAEAGVGIATIYRHFPTRADLVVAVFRHQLGAATTAPGSGETPDEALLLAGLAQAAPAAGSPGRRQPWPQAALATGSLGTPLSDRWIKA